MKKRSKVRVGTKVDPKAAFAETMVNPAVWKWQVMMGIPSLGTVRMEWALAYMNMIMPMNWSASTVIHPVRILSPLQYHVAEAQNVIVKTLLDSPWDYLLLIEDDVIVPPSLMIRMGKWLEHGKYPMVSGLYHLKANPPEPMTFRGRGNGSFEGWRKGAGAIEKRADLPKAVKPHEVCFCDGVPTGCLLISRKLLEVAWEASNPIVLRYQRTDGLIEEVPTREVFKTTREAGENPETGGYYRRVGTSDLEFCDKAMKNGWFKEAGFKEAAKMKYPFPVDLKLVCGHIDRNGVVY